jgi:hypothetical protein
MGLINVLFGRPLASSEDEGERITPTQGIPTFGLDALSSAAYGPEAALTILLPLGLLGVQYIVPLTFAVIGLLVIVHFSYRQTIAAYPNGGGSYTVATESLVASAVQWAERIMRRIDGTFANSADNKRWPRA